MSGHNKWSTIKQKKGKNDAARAKVFTKIGRELIVAIKTGGSADPSVNSKLKDTIAKAKAAKDEGEAKKASGERLFTPLPVADEVIVFGKEGK